MIQRQTNAQGVAIGAMLLYAILVLAGCSWLTDPEKTVFEQILHYSFDPQTILSTVHEQRGLKMESWVVNPTPHPSAAPVHWSQDDFYRVATALVPPDLAGRAYLVIMGLDVSCQDADQGVTRMDFHLSTRLDRQVRSDLIIIVNARDGWASVTRQDKSPGVLSSRALDPASMKVTATKALQIAENLAGRAYRQKVGNQCFVSGSGNGGSWLVMYQRQDQSHLVPDLEIEVFASGEARIVRQQN